MVLRLARIHCSGGLVAAAVWPKLKAEFQLSTSNLRFEPRLSGYYVCDLDVGVLMVPLGGEAFEGEAEGLGLSGSEWREIEIDRVGIRAGGLKNAQRNIFALSDLRHVVVEDHLNHRVDDCLVAGIGDIAVDVADSSADEILSGAHLEIRNFQVR